MMPSWDPDAFKVGYIALDGYSSTAYVTRLPDGTVSGTNKYSDEDVVVRWSDERERWEEVAA